MRHVLGVIGGTGIHEIAGLEQIEEVRVDTPFGPPSDVIVRGTLEGTSLLFLPRHGRGHRIPPHEINYRANVCALKTLGAEQLVSISAVGSMKEDIAPGDVVIVDQFIDLTKRRASTFFDGGIVAHIVFADPVCATLSAALAAAARRAGADVHAGGTYVCIEGPQFSTRAESQLYRSWGVSVIGMTGMPEAKLAREAELPYAMMALATDYDCWRAPTESVSVDMVLEVVRKSAALSKATIAALATALPDPETSPAATALSGAIMTAPGAIDPSASARLRWLIDRHPPR